MAIVGSVIAIVVALGIFVWQFKKIKESCNMGAGEDEPPKVYVNPQKSSDKNLREKCDKEHPLEKLSKSAYGNDGFMCNVCRQSFLPKPVLINLHCGICGDDYCEKCMYKEEI